MSTDQAAQDVQRQVQVWWDEVQEKGEQQVLIEAVELADGNSPGQAERLLEKYPDVALAAIGRGAARAEEVWVLEQLIDLAAGIPGDAPVPLLEQQMKEGSCLTARVAEAARAAAAGAAPAAADPTLQRRGIAAAVGSRPPRRG